MQDEEERSTSSHKFVDPSWISTFGLSRENVLNYFYTSPFYDENSNNQQLQLQSVSYHELLKMTGVEFNVEENPYEPELFIIKKQDRTHDKINVMEVYYCLDGTIYQSPTLLEVLTARYHNLVMNLDRSLEVVLDNVKHDSRKGHHCFQDESANTIKESSIGIREYPSIAGVSDYIDSL